jgi:hypothetical protein
MGKPPTKASERPCLAGVPSRKYKPGAQGSTAQSPAFISSPRTSTALGTSSHLRRARRWNTGSQDRLSHCWKHCPTCCQLLFTAIFGHGGCIQGPWTAGSVLGGCSHRGVQRWLRLIRERQGLVAGQPAGQRLHQFELAESIGHSAPPGLPREGRAEVSSRASKEGGTRKGARQALPTGHSTLPKKTQLPSECFLNLPNRLEVEVTLLFLIQLISSL